VYKIASKSEVSEELYPLWWSNADGWVEFEDSDDFEDEIIDALRLPLTGVWVNEEDYKYFSSPRGYT
jgi:hypothetical protein